MHRALIQSESKFAAPLVLQAAGDVCEMEKN
jgi:hypothetical protein